MFEYYSRDFEALLKALHRLAGKRLLCHCKLSEDCHGDCIVRAFRERWAFTSPGYTYLEAKDDIAQQWLDAVRGYRLAPESMLSIGAACCETLSSLDIGLWSQGVETFHRNESCQNYFVRLLDLRLRIAIFSH